MGAKWMQSGRKVGAELAVVAATFRLNRGDRNTFLVYALTIESMIRRISREYSSRRLDVPF